MTEQNTPERIRPELGQVGLWTFAFEDQPAGAVREAAAEVDELGYGALWFGEAMGREAFTHAALLLDATTRIPVATGIANIYLRHPLAAAAAERSLAEEHPGRFVLGLGGHRVPEQAQVTTSVLPFHGRPVAAMRAFLDQLDSAPLYSVAPRVRAARVLAALGPKMLELSRDRADGAHTYLTTPEHTAQAREILGAGPHLAAEQTVVLDTNLDRAREQGHQFVTGYTQALHQTNNLRRLGFTDEDLVGGGSDRLVDALVAIGDVEVIRKRVREHLDAGADHVCVQVLPAEPGTIPRQQWRELAAALL